MQKTSKRKEINKGKHKIRRTGKEKEIQRKKTKILKE